MPEKQLTIPANTHQEVIGYWLNSGLSDKTAEAIALLQDKLVQRFPEAVWAIPRPALHISLLNWINPLFEYSEDKNALFKEVQTEYTEAFENIVANQPPIPVTFDTINAFPDAIILKGHDDGSYEKIRNQFIKDVELREGTRQPPTIIHTTICKFLKEIDLQEVQQFLNNEPVLLQEIVDEFRLTRENILYLIAYDSLATFRLRSSKKIN